MHATAAGDLTIVSSPVEVGLPRFNILEYGIEGAINLSAVQCGSLPLHISDASPDEPPKDSSNVPVVEPTRSPPNAGTPAVDLSLSATTLDGVPVNDLHVGDNFILHVWAQDTRTNARGVYAAYLNLNWDSALASLSGNTSHGEHFSNGLTDGYSAPGSLSHVGGFADVGQGKDSRYEVFSVRIHATAAGELSIATSSAEDGTPRYFILENGIDGAVSLNHIQFGKLSIPIAGDTTTSHSAIPTIVVTAPADSSAFPITVDLGDLLSAEIKAAIASAVPLGSVSPTLLSKSADAGRAAFAAGPQASDSMSDLVSVTAAKDNEAVTDDASTDLTSAAKLELSLL